MTDADWDLVYNVHLGGTYKTSKAAWPHMLAQKYGRIINTTSAVGLYGNFGQTNYAAAKAGIIALSNTLALEGKKSNIFVNTIAPNAGTRITATVLPAEMVEALKPDYVAPLVGFLAHDTTQETGGVFEVGSGWIAKVKWERSGGVGFPSNESVQPETLVQSWKEIGNFNNGKQHYPTTTQDSFSAVQHNFENVAGGAKEKSSEVNVQAARDAQFKPHTFDYTDRDVIMYALGVGAKRTDLDLVYEISDQFKTLPTFGVVPAFDCMVKNIPFGDYLPNFNPMMLLHGEQYLELHKPIPTSGTLTSTGRIVDIIDKGKGCTVIIGVTTKNQKGEVICENEFTNFIRGVGGFGNGVAAKRPEAALSVNTPPTRQPDAVVKEVVSADLAALYRLSGDYNPLHIDPAMSKLGGFDVPILHGLCTFGISAKHVLKTYAANKPENIKSVKVRFAKHVFPGETVETRMWKEGSKVLFEVWVVERNCCAISNAAVELRETEVVKAPVVEKKEESKAGALVVDGFKASAVFVGIEAVFNAKSEAERKSEVAKIKSVFAFEISAGGKKASWFVDLKNGVGSVAIGKPVKADMTVIVSDDDFMSLASGKLQPQKAFMQGKIKVKGNVGLASKLDFLTKKSKL